MEFDKAIEVTVKDEDGNVKVYKNFIVVGIEEEERNGNEAWGLGDIYGNLEKYMNGLALELLEECKKEVRSRIRIRGRWN